LISASCPPHGPERLYAITPPVATGDFLSAAAILMALLDDTATCCPTDAPVNVDIRALRDDDWTAVQRASTAEASPPVSANTASFAYEPLRELLLRATDFNPGPGHV
jgi:hypothetical protein